MAGVPPLLMPAAHCLLQCREDIERVASDLSVEQLWTTPGGAASVGFHLRHIAGSLDRLLTYARGGQLDARQRAVVVGEKEPGSPPAEAAALIAGAQAAIDEALRVLGATRDETLLEPRAVGRAALPSTVLGLLFHAAEHTQRHSGQIATTARIARAG